MRRATIYGLRKLNSKLYVYIGSTIQSAEKRVAKHYEHARNNRHENPALQKFLIEEKFQVDVIGRTSAENQFVDEYNLIKFYLNQGHPLINKVTGVKK